MKVVIGKPGKPARVILRTRRQEDVDANLADGEVAVDVTGRRVRINGLEISADGASVVLGSNI
jgi:hypothetical protein